VTNNPLALTDPSGYSFLSRAWHGITHAFRSVGRFISGIVHTAARMLETRSRLVPMLLEGLANFIPGCQGWCPVRLTHSTAGFVSVSMFRCSPRVAGAHRRRH
jgi:hypothetical protein